MTLRVLTDTDRQSKLAIDQERLIAQLGSINKKFPGASSNALEDINVEVFQKDFLSIGDFTKAMLKIVTIAKELIGVFETETLLLNYIDTLQKLTLIESKILKYVMTYQSLYV